jgi:hypothetical protein
MKKHVDISSAKRRSPAANLILHVKSQTWNTDTHGLFDYEERTTHLKTFKSRCISMYSECYLVIVIFIEYKQICHLSL